MILGPLVRKLPDPLLDSSVQVDRDLLVAAELGGPQGDLGAESFGVAHRQ